MYRMKDKVVLVTGAARGIGAAIARRMVEEEAKVILTDLRDSEGEALAAELGASARYYHQDVTRAADWSNAVQFTEEKFGPINVLVNNAGILGAEGPIEEVEEKDFRRVLDVNLVSVFLGIKSVLLSMRKTTGGSIVNISSLAGIIGSPHTAAYTASKFAVRGITKSAALELCEHGIRVNSVHPGYVETDMIADKIPAVQTEEFKRNSSPIGRLGTPTDIANMVLFLASDEASYATGGEYIIDGGFSTQ